MAGFCPAPGPDVPLVRGLLSLVDCNVQVLVRSGYAALFEGSSPMGALLTSLLTIFMALLGYRLLLGRTQLRLGDLALTAVKIGGVLALATQWGTYQSIVYNVLFSGPEQLASGLVNIVQPQGAQGSVGVFDGLQRTFDAITGFANDYAFQAPKPAPITPGIAPPAVPPPFLGGAAFGAYALMLSAGILLFSSLGVLLAAKIVLGMLLAFGPVFIALLLFDATRGVFLGWLRASLAFAFAPLVTTLLLAFAVTMLQPSLVQLAEMRAAKAYALGPVYSILTLVMVFAGVSVGGAVAGIIIALGLKIPRARSGQAQIAPQAPTTAAEPPTDVQPRAVRIAAAAAALERRDSRVFAAHSVRTEGGASDRRTSLVTVGARSTGGGEMLPEARLGQGPRRSVRPRTGRSGPRNMR